LKAVNELLGLGIVCEKAAGAGEDIEGLVGCDGGKDEGGEGVGIVDGVVVVEKDNPPNAEFKSPNAFTALTPEVDEPTPEVDTPTPAVDEPTPEVDAVTLTPVTLGVTGPVLPALGAYNRKILFFKSFLEAGLTTPIPEPPPVVVADSIGVTDFVGESKSRPNND